jgi:hypothetical protein
MNSVIESGWWTGRRWAFLLVMCAVPILLHGCHGDEDNELFAPLMRHFLGNGHRQQLEPFVQLRVDRWK